jgi:hypothetical protein
VIKERLLEYRRKLDGSGDCHDNVEDEEDEVDKVKDTACSMSGLSTAHRWWALTDSMLAVERVWHVGNDDAYGGRTDIGAESAFLSSLLQLLLANAPFNYCKGCGNHIPRQ